MQTHPQALADGVTEDDVRRATENALLTTHNGNGPTLLFILGEDEHGRMLEMSAIVRHEDILVVHAGRARGEYRMLLDEVPARDDRAAAYGHAADGVRLTEELVAELAETAAAGHDVEYLLDRTRPGRPAPMTVGTVERIALRRDQSERLQSIARRTGDAPADALAEILRSTP